MKKMTKLQDLIYVLKGEQTEGRDFVLNKIDTTKIDGQGNRKQMLPKTNAGIAINGQPSDLDFSSLFYPKREFSLSGINRTRGHSLIEKFTFDGTTLAIEGIPISFYDKKTGKEIKFIETRTPAFQMSDLEVDTANIENFVKFVKEQHEANEKRKTQEEKEKKFGIETTEYIRLKNELESKNWKEYKNGNLRLFKKNMDNQMFIIVKDSPGYREIETDENTEGEIIFTIGKETAIAKETEEGGIKITRIEKPLEKPAEKE